ncbi:MATE family efflux transporter [Bengtsoniella intestinalis]|uniref:MATE family efflux transporter n=1 Tax=Bengtsoniella intestinalis TaxID=3073143 RepID=UPI00391F8E15
MKNKLENTQKEEVTDSTKDNDYGTASISSLFLKVVLPSMIAMLITGIQGVIDGLFLGNYMGDSAMASANIASPFLQILMGITMVISIGGTAFISRTLGVNDLSKAQDIFKSCFIALSVSSICIILSAWFYSDHFAILFGASDTLLQGASDYIRVIGIFSPFVMFYVLFAFTNRVIGKPHLLLMASIACVVANITLNYLFIAVLQLGMIGAGLATGLSYSLGFLINLKPILSKNTVVNVFNGRFHWKLLGVLLFNGSSEGITSISTAISVWVFNLTFMYYYGDSGVASFTIVNYIAQFTTTLLFGMGEGVTPIIAYHYGANLQERIEKTMKFAVLGNFLVGICSCLSVQIWGEALIRLFADGNGELISMTLSGAKIYALSFLLSGFNILISAYFTAKGDAINSVIVSSSRGLVFILIGIFTLPSFFDFTGVWLVVPFAEVVTLGIILYLLSKQSKTIEKQS